MTELTSLQLLLIALVGDIDPFTGDVPAMPEDGVFYQHMPDLWTRYADKATISARLRELYVVRDGCDLLLSVVAPEVSLSAPGASIQLNQRAATYQARRRDAQDEIERMESNPSQLAIENGSSSTGSPVMTSIAAVEPISPPGLWGPNLNDPRYAGSPYYRPYR